MQAIVLVLGSRKSRNHTDSGLNVKYLGQDTEITNDDNCESHAMSVTNNDNGESHAMSVSLVKGL